MLNRLKQIGAALFGPLCWGRLQRDAVSCSSLPSWASSPGLKNEVDFIQLSNPVFCKARGSPLQKSPVFLSLHERE